ncbi:hypothetical protein WJX77_011513 [Trebouxia sp. C0004]
MTRTSDFTGGWTRSKRARLMLSRSHNRLAEHHNSELQAHNAAVKEQTSRLSDSTFVNSRQKDELSKQEAKRHLHLRVCSRTNPGEACTCLLPSTGPGWEGPASAHCLPALSSVSHTSAVSLHLLRSLSGAAEGEASLHQALGHGQETLGVYSRAPRAMSGVHTTWAIKQPPCVRAAAVPAGVG